MMYYYKGRSSGNSPKDTGTAAPSATRNKQEYKVYLFVLIKFLDIYYFKKKKQYSVTLE